MTEVSRLEPMLAQVQAYGDQHRDALGTAGLVWGNGDDASVFISFTGNLDAHRAALAEHVLYPDELIVCQVPIPSTVAASLVAALTEELAGRFASVGQGIGAVQVTLRPSDTALAEELHARYGDAVELTVGGLRYPIDDASSTCPDVPELTSLPGLEITVVPPSGPLRPDDFGQLSLVVRLTNVGSTPIRFGSGTPTGVVLDQSGGVVATESGGRLLGDEIPVDLEPGESTEYPFTAATASCDPRLGYALPPGEYQVIAGVQHSDGDVTILYSSPTSILIDG